MWWGIGALGVLLYVIIPDRVRHQDAPQGPLDHVHHRDLPSDLLADRGADPVGRGTHGLNVT
jgi:hypothetical protein